MHKDTEHHGKVPKRYEAMKTFRDRLDDLAYALRLAKRSLRIIRQNLAWAAGYNALAMPAAALGWVQPWMAAIGMSASSLVVVLNALRLSKKTGTRDEGRGAR